MNVLLVSIIFSLGASTWIYVKIQRQSGAGNNQSALMGAALAFFVIFIVVFSLGRMLPSN
jgi:hypothetical protein